MALLATVFIFSQRLIQNSLKPSILFHAQIKPATSAAIADTTNTIGLANNTPHRLCNAGITVSVIIGTMVSNRIDLKIKKVVLTVLNAVFNIPIACFIFINPWIALPITNKIGPTAATNKATVTNTCLTGAGKLFNHLTNTVRPLTIFVNTPVVSPKLSWNASQALLNCFNAPLNVLLSVLDISSAVPSLFSSALVKSSILSAPVLHNIPIPFIESAVKVVISAAVFCASPIPSVALSTSLIMSVILLKLPLASCTFTEVFPICIAPFFIF